MINDEQYAKSTYLLMYAKQGLLTAHICQTRRTYISYRLDKESLSTIQRTINSGLFLSIKIRPVYCYLNPEQYLAASGH